MVLVNLLLLRHSLPLTETEGSYVLKASDQEGSASSLTAGNSASPLQSAAAPHELFTPVSVADSSGSSVFISAGSTSATLLQLDSAERESMESTKCFSSSLVKSVMSLALLGPEPLWLCSAGLQS